MNDFSYAALPSDEQRRLVNQMKDAYSVRELATMFGKGVGTIARWTNPSTREKGLESSRRWKANNKARVSQTDRLRHKFAKVFNFKPQYCDCAEPVCDSRMDRFCRRNDTCIYCSKPRGGA